MNPQRNRLTVVGCAEAYVKIIVTLMALIFGSLALGIVLNSLVGAWCRYPPTPCTDIPSDGAP